PRSRGRDDRRLAAAERPRDRAGARADRRRAVDLRVAPERDRRLGRALSQDRERRAAEGRLRGAGDEPCHRRSVPRRGRGRRAAAPRFLPRIAAALGARGCELRGDAASRALVPDLKPATDADWDTEYLDLVLSVAVVPSLDAALAFIARHSTGLAEAIVTEDYRASRRFLAEVDAAAVFVNASTRFTDGYEFGFGAEVGISTNRLHARGPMGLRELTTYKYQVQGSGQIRA